MGGLKSETGSEQEKPEVLCFIDGGKDIKDYEGHFKRAQEPT
jgi:hypothetical protein